MKTIEEKRKEWLDHYFSEYKNLEIEMDNKIQELTNKGFGVSKVYHYVRKLRKYESYPDHIILLEAIRCSGKDLSRSTIKYHFNRLLGPEYDNAEKNEIIKTHFGF